MLLAIVYFLMPFVISYSLTPIIKNIAIKRGWYDQPNERKVHTKAIPALGGLAIFISLAYTLFWIPLNWESNQVYFILPAIAILFLTGLWDDMRNLSASKRLIVQCLCAGLCFLGGCALQSDYGLLGISNLPIVIQFIGTVFFIVLLINAFNLIDGINGLAGGLALITFLTFALLFFNAGDNLWFALALMSAGATVGFLNYNFTNASIFLGDNGSTVLGLLLAIFFIQYINLPAALAGQSQFFVVGISLLALPIMDLMRVSLSRMSKGQSPFHADQSHIHHMLLKSFGTHRSATTVLLIFQLSLFMLTQFFAKDYSSFTVFLLMGGAYVFFIQVIKVGQELTAIKDMEKERRQTSFLY